jgi:hypothetical protein
VRVRRPTPLPSHALAEAPAHGAARVAASADGRTIC